MPEVTVLVKDDHRSKIASVAKALEGAGLEVANTLQATGVITGTVRDARAVEALRGVPGVAAVEVGREVRLPPPDAPVQ